MTSRSNSSKLLVFVLMPFSEEYEDIYQSGIKPACEEIGCKCERVDEQNFKTTILNQIYDQISNADIIIAEMSAPNLNVYYEVGYAHALKKTVILSAKKEEQIPFDLKNYQVIVYDGKIFKLKRELVKKLKWAKEETRKDFRKKIYIPIPSIENQIKIDRYLEEINDFRDWNDEEASLRIVGNIQRLMKLGVKGEIINLERCNLIKANLRGADLIEATFAGAEMKEANLERANLYSANLEKVNLSGANLEEAQLSSANLKSANLESANLHGVRLDWASLEMANLKNADISWASLKDTNLRRANLKDAKLKLSILAEANLEGAKGLTIDQLLDVFTLYKVKGLKSEFRVELKDKKPDLFEKPPDPLPFI